MRAEDKIVFADAARQFQAWILVRRTNPRSLQYIGKPGYVPKRIDCKPKTADLDGQEKLWAGLVVAPELCPGAFKPGKRDEAVRMWEEFVAQERLGKAGSSSPYRVDTEERSRHYGCLQLDGQYIHGDYDLYDIIPVDHPSANLAAVEMLLGQPHRRGVLVTRVLAYVNGRIGIPMVQHGGEAQYKGHREQPLDAFGPNGEQCTILNEFSVRAWYRDRFRGRRTLGSSRT